MHTLQFDETRCRSLRGRTAGEMSIHTHRENGTERNVRIAGERIPSSARMRDLYACVEYCPMGNHPFF
jgi:hypothetical protein